MLYLLFTSSVSWVSPAVLSNSLRKTHKYYIYLFVIIKLKHLRTLFKDTEIDYLKEEKRYGDILNNVF